MDFEEINLGINSSESIHVQRYYVTDVLIYKKRMIANLFTNFNLFDKRENIEFYFIL